MTKRKGNTDFEKVFEDVMRYVKVPASSIKTKEQLRTVLVELDSNRKDSGRGDRRFTQINSYSSFGD